MLNTALDQFAIPGDAGFPLNQAFEAPRDRQDAETLRQYVGHLSAPSAMHNFYGILRGQLLGICPRRGRN